MKLLSNLSIIRGIGYMLVFILCVNCKKDFNSTNLSQPPPGSISESASENLVYLFQTRTSNSWFNINNNKYEQWGAQYVATDDNSYAYTKKILKTQRIYLILLDFGFTIPSNAVIDIITVTVKRFKSGGSQVKDCFVRLTAPHADPIWEGWRPYGVEMANPANLWPGTETEVSYSQSGSGPNGIFYLETYTTMPYQWTPAMINHPSFGFYLLTNFPDKNFYYAYFDQVKITVKYSLPEVVL